MKVIHHPADLPGVPRGVCIAIGVFDGVHLGHQQVIRQTTTDASHHEAAAVVVTFDRHPNCIVAPQAVPGAIYSLEQKLASIAELGVEAALVIRFDEEFSRRPAAEFIGHLVEGFGRLRSVCVGREFTFGYRRQGNVDLLEKLGANWGYQVHALAAVSLDGQSVSSTRIRELIRSGHLDEAGQMLGRDYRIAGRVLRGDQLGRKLGFPTANIDVRGLALPPRGVYAVHVFHGTNPLRGVANIGVRPTIDPTAANPGLEVHLFDTDVDLYDATLSVQFVSHLRDESRFTSREELSRQIAVDIKRARECF